MAVKKLCFFIGEMGATKTSHRARYGWLHHEIIEPVIISDFPEFELRRSPMVRNPKDVQLNELTNANLVIVDMTNTTEDPNIVYQVGWRHIFKRPIVHITSTDLRFTKGESTRDFKSIRFVVADDKGHDEQIRKALKTEIATALSEDFSGALSQTQFANKEELSRRVEEVADAISQLRLNSLSEHVEQLREIAGWHPSELRRLALFRFLLISSTLWAQSKGRKSLLLAQ